MLRHRLIAAGLAMEPPEGEFLYNQVKKYGAKRVLELGAADGYSGIWLALGLRKNGGKLITIELDEKRYAQATTNFAATGLDGIINARNANALTETEKVERPLDLFFIDACKYDYIKYLKRVLPCIWPGRTPACFSPAGSDRKHVMLYSRSSA